MTCAGVEECAHADRRRFAGESGRERSSISRNAPLVAGELTRETYYKTFQGPIPLPQFLALSGGMVSNAHFILIPEYTFDLLRLVEMINLSKKLKSRYTLVVVAEGAKEAGGEIVARRADSMWRATQY